MICQVFVYVDHIESELFESVKCTIKENNRTLLKKMAEKLEVVSQQFSKPIKILKWKVSESYFVSIGTILFTYDFASATKSEQRKLKSPRAGFVQKLLTKEGAIVNPGEPIIELKPCIHPTVVKDMCADCGADLRKEEIDSTASVPMIHSVPDLKVSKELAQKIGKADEERLIQDRKLVLLVDLDQTLIHTTNDIIPPNIKDVYHFQLYGPHSPWYHTRLRPSTHKFLTNISPYFELHICTFGARNYAHRITQILDPDGRFFSNRVLSRDECFDPTSKTANLSALFPCGDHMVCIIDDREDVWSYATNLIHVKPYHFFQHTGDINAPPGLDKHEEDEKMGVDLSKIISTEDKSTNTDGTMLKEENDERREEIEDDEEEEVEEERDEEEDEDEGIKEGDSNEFKMNGIEETKNTFNKSTQAVDSTVKEECCLKENLPIMENTEENNEDDNVIRNSSEPKDQILSLQTDEISKKFDESSINADDCIKSNSNTDENAISEPQNFSNEFQENLPKTNQQKSDEVPPNIEDHTKSILNSSLNLIEIDDSDDYLLYLEEILKKIHCEFYELYDQLEAGIVPDLKKIIPEVKSQVLKNTKLCFSGLVPTHIKLQQSKAYQIARSLGAEVTQNIEEDTTHLVAVRRGTAKVNAARRKKNLFIVTPDWLWACAERWERTNEKLFPLSNKGSKNRHPPPHCSSPEHVPEYDGVHGTPSPRKRTDSGRFMDTINPLMSFSTDDIADMDKEVEDELEEDFGSSDVRPKEGEDDNESSSSSEESITAEVPQGNKQPSLKRKRKVDDFNDVEEAGNESSDSESPSVKFHKGESVDDVLDVDNSDSEGSVDPPDEMDDGEWNMMGAALEREFLSNN